MSELVPDLSSAVVTAGVGVSLPFTFADPGGDPVKNWLVDWGDGQESTLPGGSGNDSPPTSVTQTFTHSYAHPGAIYTVNAVATSDDGIYIARATVQVNGAAPWASDNLSVYGDSVAASEGNDGFGINFTDPNGSGAVTYTVDWGDNTGNTTFQATAGTPVPTQYHTYGEEGQYLLSVTGSDGAASHTFTNVSETTPSLTTPADQVVASGQGVMLAASYSGLGPNDTAVAFINWGDGTGAHRATVSGGTSGTVTAYLDHAPGPGTYFPYITIYDEDGAAAAASSTLYVWGAALGDGTKNDLLMASNDGTQNLQPVSFYFPHPYGIAFDITASSSDPAEDDLWPTEAPATGATPLLGGATSTFTFTTDPTESVRTYYVGATQGDLIANPLWFSFTGTVDSAASTSQPAPGTQPAPTVPATSNAVSNGSITIVSLNDPNKDVPNGTNVTDNPKGNNPGRKWLVGQWVDLKLVRTAPGNVGALLWTVSGNRLSDYSVTAGSATAYPLDSHTGLQSEEIKFFWVATAGAGPEVDKVTATSVIDTHPISVSTTFNVYRPTNTVTTTSGSTILGLDPRNQKPFVQLSSPNPAIQGIAVKSTVTMPDGVTFAPGKWEFVQKVKPSEVRWLINTGQTHVH